MGDLRTNAGRSGAGVPARIRSFSLRGLLLFVLLCACLAGWGRHVLDGYRDRERRIANFRQRGFTIKTRPAEPQWLLRWLTGRQFHEPIAAFLDKPATRTRRAIGDADLADIADWTQLETLSLFQSSVTDAGLRYCRRLRELKSLSLPSNQTITDAGLRAFDGIESLEYLKLAGTRCSDAGLRTFCKSSDLKSLDLSGTTVADDGMFAVSRFPVLARLSFGPGITAAGISRLWELQSLVEINVRGATDPLANAASRLTGLRTLVIDGEELTDAGIDCLASSSVFTLRIHAPKMTETSLLAFTNAPNITSLSISGARFPMDAVLEFESRKPQVAGSLRVPIPSRWGESFPPRGSRIYFLGRRSIKGGRKR